MRHLPNLLTLCNLICGCIAIAFILESRPFQVQAGENYYYITGTEQAYIGALFICLAALFDLADGPVARGLKIFSPIGKDLDSLADLVSFGVAPSMILYKMLWASWMREEGALDIPMFFMIPAFLIACFAALRLARFNVSPSSGSVFQGLPVPATGILVASLPLINFYNPLNLGGLIQGSFALYVIIALLCWLMVSRIPFFKLMPARWDMHNLWPRLLLTGLTAVSFIWLGVAAVPFGFVLYLLLSLIWKPAPAGS